MLKRLGAVCLIAPVIVLAACSKPYLKPHTDPPHATFPGILDGLSARNPKQADVVLIHGMCSHEVLGNSEACRTDPGGELWRQSWVHNANRILAGSMGLGKIDIEKPQPVGSDGGLLFDATLSGGDVVLKTHAIVWSPIAARSKQELCYDVNEKTDVCQSPSKFTPWKGRGTLNGQLKSQLMNDCLSDVLIYAGDRDGPSIREVAKAALVRILTGSTLADDKVETAQVNAALAATPPLAIISESLGSKIAFDAMLELAAEPKGRAIAADAMARTMHVYMGANQLPILALAHVSAPLKGMEKTGSQTARTAFGELAQLAALRREGQASRRAKGGVGAAFGGDEPLRVTVFTDPNDLLSYALSGSGALPEGIVLTDVVVSNDYIWFGYVENPLQAHLGYRTNCKVQQAIARGSNALAMDCK